jgi:hypothetical protein
MIASRLRPVRAALMGAILVIGQVAAVSAASPDPAQGSNQPQADATITAEPAVITADVQAGTKSTKRLTLRAREPLDISIESMGLGQSAEDGSFTFVPADEDKSPYSARAFITASPASFHMEPGDVTPIDVTISLPDGADDGERYAILKVNALPVKGDGNVAIGIALGVSVLVKQPGAPGALIGSIQGLHVADTAAGSPITVTGHVLNTGDTHYGAAPAAVYQTATLRSSDGTQLATARTVLQGNSIVPTFSRNFTLNLDPGKQLPVGKYKVDVVAGIESGPELDRASTSFEITGAPPVAPPAIGSPSDILPFVLAGLLAAALLMVLIVLGAQRRRHRTAAS